MSVPRGTTLWVTALVLVATLGGVRAASAQTPADTMEVAQAVAGVVGDLLLPNLGMGRPPLLGKPTQAFDRWVTLRLQQAHRLEMMPARADTARGWSRAASRWPATLRRSSWRSARPRSRAPSEPA